MHPRGSEKMKRLVTLCVLITILPFFSASFLFSVPFPLVFVWSVLISLLDSGQAWGHHFLWEGFTDPTTLTFQAGHSIYRPLPSLSTYMSVSIINSSLMLKTKFSMFCWILDLKSTHLFHIPNPSPSTKTTFNIVSPSRHSFPPLAHSTNAIQQVLSLCQTVPGFKCKKLFSFSPGWSSTFIALTASYFQPLSNLCPFPIFQVPGAYLPAISAYISSVTQTQHTHINLENYNAYIIHFLPEYIPFNSYSQYPLLTKALIIFHFWSGVFL